MCKSHMRRISSLLLWLNEWHSMGLIALHAKVGRHLWPLVDTLTQLLSLLETQEALKLESLQFLLVLLGEILVVGGGVILHFS